MAFGIYDLIKIIGALAFFIYGMKVMSDGIQKAAGSQLRNILRRMTRNRFIGVFSGFLITALLQSSSATTVMVVSFANAGLLTLIESIGVIMGANIGTTVTAWLISIFGFKFKIASFALPMMAVGMPLLFANKAILKNVGEAILGFAILFLGLEYLKDSVPDLKNNPEVLNFLSQYANYGMLSTIIFVGVGTLLTIIVQSSSAAMALTLTLLFNGVLPFEIAAAMVLGENIGTTITANLAALVGNVHATRAARAHFLFNVIGVFWMILIFPFFIKFIQSTWEPSQSLLQTFIPDLASEQEELQLSLFHTSFNIINTTLMIGFIPLLARLVIKIVPSRGEEDEDFHLKYIGANVSAPELVILEAQKEVVNFGEITSRMSGFAQKLLEATDAKKRRKMLNKLQKFEEITDQMEIEITEYLTRLSNDKVTPKTSVTIRSIMNICNDMERIGDIFYQLSKTVEKKVEEKIWFNQHQRDRLAEMFALIDKAFATMIENISAPHYGPVSKVKAVELEEKINELRNLMRQENLEQMGTEDYNNNSAMVYTNIFSSLERVGDHIINVSESVVGEI